jgi:hypothetical protein
MTTKLKVYDIPKLVDHQLPDETLTQTLNRIINEYSQGTEEIEECKDQYNNQSNM